MAFITMSWDNFSDIKPPQIKKTSTIKVKLHLKIAGSKLGSFNGISKFNVQKRKAIQN